jgi:hypothetical protein
MDLLEVSDKQDVEVPAVFSHPANNYNLSDPTPLVIPTGAPQERRDLECSPSSRS